MRLVNGDMSKISDQIMEGMKTAMRAKDSVTLNTLRALKTALTNTAIAKGGLGTQLEEAEELAVVRKQIKQREDSTEQFRSAGRPELADKEEAEIAVLKQFMPAELTAEETEAMLEAVLKETGASTKKDMGQVMNSCRNAPPAGSTARNWPAWCQPDYHEMLCRHHCSGRVLPARRI